ncbi:hypothetical protein, partial [Henriciella sp.]|uniref:hypothetical protein n=1 Tax=Henriciella sp. TaxID=1968823 RepID=UPI002621283A
TRLILCLQNRGRPHMTAPAAMLTRPVTTLKIADFTFIRCSSSRMRDACGRRGKLSPGQEKISSKQRAEGVAGA